MQTARKILLCVSVVILHFPAYAADWPQWRGPERSGVAVGEKLPDVLPQKLKPVWRVRVGLGYSSPLVVGDRVYQMAREEKAPEGDVEICLALDAVTGKILWRHAYPVPYTVHSAAVAAGPGPKATPAVSDGKIYLFGITEILTCLDCESGRLIWRENFEQKYKPIWPETGASASPLIVGKLCIAQMGIENKGGVVAFDKATGKEAWRTPGDGPSYTAPELFTFGGIRQVVTLTQESLVGIDVESGRQLWRAPFKTEYNQNIVSPVVYKNLVIYTGVDQGVFAIRIEVAEDSKGQKQFKAIPAWSNKKDFSYMSAPVVHGDHGFMLSGKRKGSLICFKAETGELVWVSPGRFGDYASITLAGDKLLVLNDSAQMKVIPAEPAGYKELTVWEVAPSATWAHPALVNSRLYVKDVDSLACLEF